MSFILKTAFLFGSTATCQRYLFSFGNSYSTVSFDITQVYNQPQPSNPIGNPAFPGITTSGGANYIGFLTASQDQTLTYDLAVAGAVVNNLKTHGTNDGFVRDFIQQFQQFSDNLVPAPPSVPWTGSNSLFTVFFGINDICTHYFFGGPASPPLDQILDDYFTLLDTLYNDGARRFILLSIPPVTETPMFKSSQFAGSAPLAASNITTWNDMLESRSADFQTGHSGTDVRIFTTEPDWDAILSNPTANGAPDNTCTNMDGTSCLFWDPFHPGQAIHRAWGNDITQLAQDMGFFG